MPDVKTIQRWLTTRVAQLLAVEPETIDIYEPFANYGLGSADAIGLSGELEEWLGQDFAPTLMFDYPCIAALAGYLGQGQAPRALTEHAETAQEFALDEPVAIIGIGCRFPGGAETPARFWELLREGFDAVENIPPDRWDVDAFYHPDPDIPGKMYTRVGSFLTNLAYFDASFFGISAREALSMHPQQRLLLEVAWEALEHAGLAPSALAGSSTGVFLGLLNLQDYTWQEEPGASLDNPYYGTGNAASIAAGRLSYFFNFQGPSLVIDTACSSSLVATHLACQSLRRRECQLALAGGVNTTLAPSTMVNACNMHMLARDGHCKTFDATADGFALGEGCGLVVLKRLVDARADGDPILAVIRGSAINQDGRSNGITAPNRLAQEAVIRQALARAGVAPRQVAYVETHGSGTSLGDPIEVEALSATLGSERSPQQPLILGALKTNIGHTIGAAGIAGLIKTTLALQHGEIPPNLHLQQANPYINWQACPLVLPTSPMPWPKGEVARIAGVSSFGWSGTNAHLILEEAPACTVGETSGKTHALLSLSARTEDALERATDRLLAHLLLHPMLPLADVAYTCHTGRDAFACRRTLVCESVQDAISALQQPESARMASGRAPKCQRAVAFLFPGERAHSDDEDLVDSLMRQAGDLYEQEPVFRSWVDRCCQQIQRLASTEQQGSSILRTTSHAPQSSSPVPGVAFAHASAHPGADTYANASGKAGLMTLEEFRPPEQAQHAPGHTNGRAHLPLARLAAFVIDYALAQLLLSWGLVPAALLGTGAGEYAAACLAEVLSTEEALRILIRQAYAGSDEELPFELTLQEPRIPCISAVTGTWLCAEEATCPQYWSGGQRRATFAQGIGLLQRGSEAEQEWLFLQVGAGDAPDLSVECSPPDSQQQCTQIIPTLPDGGLSPRAGLLSALGQLWIEGIALDWHAFYAGQQHTRVTLPLYPFEQQRYWSQPAAPTTSAPAGKTAEESPAQMKREHIDDWFYFPGWKSAGALAPFSCQDSRQATTGWLFFLDECGIGARLMEELRPYHAQISVVTPAQTFRRVTEGVYTLHPTTPAHYEALFKEIRARGYTNMRIVHLWTLSSQDQLPACDQHGFEQAARKGFYSVLTLVQALEHLSCERSRLMLVSCGIQQVLGNDIIIPANATLLGPCLVVPFEYPDITCHSIDIPPPASKDQRDDDICRALLGELTSGVSDSMVALRGNRRWLPASERISHTEGGRSTQILRQGGVYLITGGLGGIGLAMAEHLARTVQARLVLVGRQALPPREQWPHLLSASRQDDGQRVRAIERLEALGAQLLILQADVTDPVGMQQVITRTLATFGELHGVLHAAGVPGMGLIQLKTPEQAGRVLAPKVQGLLVLQQVLAAVPLDFLALFSSITSATGGGPGQVDYAAANAFLAAYAQQPRQIPHRTLAIDWSEWQWNAWEEGLAGYDGHVQAFLKEHRQHFGITFAEGAEAFERVLALQEPRVLVSTQDLQHFGELLQTLSATSLLQQPGGQMRQIYPRPALASSYVAPASALEQTIASLWEGLLGVAPVGIHDNFFELGGNSLVGITLIARVRKTLHLENLPAYVLYEAPTVGNLAGYIERGRQVSTIKERQERGEKRRAGLTQRMETMRQRK
jgi:acyl transferase domain-containing protein/acyl carrier protein